MLLSNSVVPPSQSSIWDAFCVNMQLQDFSLKQYYRNPVNIISNYRLRLAIYKIITIIIEPYPKCLSCII